jgi:hypothetical protein
LNALAFKMGRLLARDWIERDRVEYLLVWGARECGLVSDDGLAQVRATIASGLGAGITRPYPDLPEGEPAMEAVA